VLPISTHSSTGSKPPIAWSCTAPGAGRRRLEAHTPCRPKHIQSSDLQCRAVSAKDTRKGWKSSSSRSRSSIASRPVISRSPTGPGDRRATAPSKQSTGYGAQDIETAPHIACVGSARTEIRDILSRYREQGIRRVVALRGDLPSGMGGGTGGDFRYANELVSFIRAEFGDTFKIEVAAYPEYHPQSGSPERDLANFKRKVEAGADAAITQYFYNPDAYFAFVRSCERAGVAIPIVPGIMPITNYTQLARFSDACGAEIPRWVRRRLEGYGDDVESHTCIRARGCSQPLPSPDRGRRARSAFLYHESVGSDPAAVEGARTPDPGLRPRWRGIAGSRLDDFARIPACVGAKAASRAFGPGDFSAHRPRRAWMATAFTNGISMVY
jgi:5,10-methylenetetrahydrofolate reductase